MTYKDPKMGIIDLNTEELPKAQKLTQTMLSNNELDNGINNTKYFQVV